MKQCPKCKEEHQESTKTCEPCKFLARLYGKKYRQKYPDRCNQSAKEYVRTHKEAVLKHRRDYRERLKERLAKIGMTPWTYRRFKLEHNE